MSIGLVYPGAIVQPLGTEQGTWQAPGLPASILNHYTVGCANPYATLKAGGLGVHFCVMRTGEVLQYLDLDQWAWHAFDMSKHAVGIEHEANPGMCDLTVAQLQASAKLNAWLCEHFDIPKVRVPGASLFKRGIGSHNDGLEPGQNTWDPNGHYDGIWKSDVSWTTTAQNALLNRSPWTAAQFIQAVNGEEDMAEANDFALGIASLVLDGDTPKTAGIAVAHAINFVLGAADVYRGIAASSDGTFYVAGREYAEDTKKAAEAGGVALPHEHAFAGTTEPAP